VVLFCKFSLLNIEANMRVHPRSAFHSVLLFIFIFSQVTVQPASAAVTGRPEAETILQGEQSVPPRSLEAMSGPEPADGGSVVLPAESLRSTESILKIAAELQLLGYTLPPYADGIYHEANGLSIEPLVAYNLIVDSNVLSPSSYGPSAATFGARFCNTGSSNLTNVSAYIGNYDADYNGTLADAAPGTFPRRSETAPSYDDPGAETAGDPFEVAYGNSTTNPLVGSTLTDYGATNAPFALQLASGTTPPEVDASRYIGDLAPGQCKTEYWMVTYPRKACSSGTVCDINNASREDVTGGVKPEDDLWLPYFFWGTSTGATTATSYRWNAITMRNEISAMANKIWPNGDNKVPDEYVAAIAEVVGWDTLTPSGTSTVYPGDTVLSEGIWYDLGNVGAGFDNNGDFVPDRNVWVQPIGDASGYDPGCFRLVRTYGLVIVKLNDGTEQLIPFVDQMYFENIPENNIGAVGLVYYEYAALDGICTASLTPYQEVASGYDNEKFNADYGAGIPPLQSQESNMTLNKTGPNTIGLTGTINYLLTFTLPDIDNDPPTDNRTVTIGQPSYGVPLTYSDAVPVGLQYVANSAIQTTAACSGVYPATVDMSSNYGSDLCAALWHSRDGGATWIMGDPGNYTSTSASNQLVLQWRLQSGVTSPASGDAYTGTVQFNAVVPGTYPSVRVENEGCLKIGQGPPFVCDPHTTVITGNSSITGLVWRDDAITTGVPGNALPDGTEAGIPAVTVNLYWDNNGDGDYSDTGDFLYATTNSVNYTIVAGYVDVNGGGINSTDNAALPGVNIIAGGLDLNGDNVVNATDAGFFGGYVVINGRIDSDRSGTITTTDNGTLVGVYNFGSLPATTSVSARYIVVVDPRDSDIPTGYGPTTPISYMGINLAVNTAYGDATNTSEPSDFGFAPALSLDKTVMTSTSIAVGNTVEYRISVQNNLPGDGSGGNSCVYNTYATSEGSRSTSVNYVDSFDDNGPGASPDTVVNVFTAPEPDGLYAVGSYKASGTQVLDGIGFAMGPQGGTITNVKARVKLYIDAPFDVSLTQADYGAVEYWAGTGPTKYAGTPVGSQAEQNATKVELEKHIGIANAGWYELDLGATNAATGQPWTWADLASGNSIHIVYQAGKQATGDQVLIYIDAIGLQVTTSGTCSAASATLNPVPLTDTFDDAYFDFISADPPVSTTGTGTLTWNNVGPLYPGQTRYITVYMRAAQTGASPATINTATSTNTKFSSGLPANSPVSDTAAVTISTNTNTRSLTGRVFDDNVPTGWQTPLWTAGGSGYEAGDTGIQYIPVDIYACVSTATNTMIIDEGNNRSCAVAGGTWRLIQTTSTSSNGDYTFNNLAQGYYRVRVHSEFIVGAQTADVNATGNTACATPGCDSWSNGESESLDLASFVGDVDNFTSVTRVNFGYNVPSGAYDIGDLVFFDWDGDGIQDAEDEPMPNVTMRLLAADGTTLTQTNTSGIYSFLDRSPAYYTVEVDTTTLPSGVVQTKDPDSTVDNRSGFSLTADKFNVDFGYRPYGSGTIGDTVFKDINGNGTQDGTGETGIAGATVLLQVDWDGNGTYVTIKTATTDSNGKYLFSGLPQGSYRVSIDLSSNAAVIPDDTFGNNYFPSNGTDSGTAVYMDKTLPTSTSSDLTADFGFAPPASIGDTVYQDVNRDGTQDTGEPGINGVTVTLYTFTDAGNRNGVYDLGEGFLDLNNDLDWDTGEPFNDIPNGRYNPGEALTSTGLTQVTATVGDRQGIYQFEGLEPGYYTVQVTPPAGSVLTGDPNTDGISCDGLHNPADPGEPNLNLCDHREGMRLYNGTNYTGADFGYYLSGSFGDKVWIDTDNDGHVDLGERGISNVTVNLYPYTDNNNNNIYDTGDVLGALSTSAVTDADGNYIFTNVPDGKYVVRVDIADPDIDTLIGNGLIPTYDPDGVNNHETSVTLSTGAVTHVGGCATTPNGCDGESDALYLDADFGYNYSGVGELSGTICLETVDNGICGTTPTGVEAGESAYNTATVYLYRWIDADSDGNIDPGETSQFGVTQTGPNGDYSFTDLPDGYYYIVAIGAPQSGLSLNTEATDLPEVGDDAAGYEEVVPTTNVDGTVLSVYQVVQVPSGDPVVENVDFAFSLDGSYDFGDLPQGSVGGTTYNYSTLLESAPSGPRHLLPLTPTLYLGTGVDVDVNGISTSSSASADTEENGVTIGTDNSWGDGSGQLNFDITGSGWLVGWIDFNADGDFSDSREVVINQAASGDITNYNITTPYNGTTVLPPTSGYLYARFRLFTSEPAISALAYVGATTGGEVEDYRFPISGGGTTTPVTVAYFHARRQGSSVNFEWSTATETGNVGFNLYVEGKNGLVQLNRELIPSRVVDSHEKQDYTFSLDIKGSLFYVEDVSILGETRLHGPFQVGHRYGGMQESDKIDRTAVLKEHNEKTADRQSDLIKDMKVPAEAKRNPAWLSWFSELQLTTTFNLEVRESGIYRVSYEMLKDAGLDLKDVPATKITITNHGEQIPVYVEGEGKFGPGDFIEFYGEALDTIYTDTNIYTVQVSSARANRIKEDNAKPANKALPQPSYVETLIVNNQRTFANYAPGKDAWYDKSMMTYTTPKTWDVPFEVRDLAAVSSGAEMMLVLWGGADLEAVGPDHHVKVSINNVLVADQVFDGLVERVIEIKIPAGTLREGTNTLQLALPGDTGAQWDMINLDRYSLSYQRLYRAKTGRLTFTATGQAFSITNLPNENVVVYRLNEKGNLERLKKVLVQAERDRFTATFAGTKDEATYFVTTVDAIFTPEIEATHVDADLHQPAQYLIISHPDFIDGLKPLVEARQAQGLTVSVVDVTDLYAQYSYGIFEPQAIRDYIAFAAQNLGTQYVLLVGGDTYDYRNYLGVNSLSFIPSLYIQTSELVKFVPVDPLYADTDGNNVPDLAIGRFPARTTAELDLLVRKTLVYQSKNYGRTATFVSDKFDGVVSFKNISNNIASGLPSNWAVENINMDDSSVSAARTQLLAAMNRGTALIVFTGHSGPQKWTFSGLFGFKDPANLTNAGKPFVVVQWGCWNTYHVDPIYKHMVQSFLFPGDKGAVAVLGASTQTNSESEEKLGVLLLPRMTEPGMPIGKALLDAKLELAETDPELLDVLLGWTLMGDPALVIQP
jgi:hypothetical protein